MLRLVPRSKTTTNRDHSELARRVLARNFESAAKALHEHIDSPAKALARLPDATLIQAFGAGDESRFPGPNRRSNAA